MISSPNRSMSKPCGSRFRVRSSTAGFARRTAYRHKRVGWLMSDTGAGSTLIWGGAQAIYVVLPIVRSAPSQHGGSKSVDEVVGVREAPMRDPDSPQLPRQQLDELEPRLQSAGSWSSE